MDKFHKHRLDCPFSFAPLDVCDCVEKNLRDRIKADAKRMREAVKMLDDKDREYNRLTNDMIERHAAQIAGLTKEAESWRSAFRALQKTVDAHIGAVLAEAADAAWQADSLELATHGESKIAERILALRPDALQALERVRREARAEALEQAAAVAKEIANQYVGYMGRIERAIRALIEAERWKP